jgi:adenylosuccinate lyase
MVKIWSDENKYRRWSEIELLVCEAQTKIGIIPKGVIKKIKNKISFDPERISEIEKITKHDFVAFLKNISENIGIDSRFLHLGLTSSDIKDTALSLNLRDALKIIIKDLNDLIKVLKEKAIKHKYDLMVGRTHGIHAEPTTFGVKIANWAFEMDRNRKRIMNAKDEISYCKISGAVGTYSNISPEVEKYVCEKLDLKPEPVSSQIIHRDRHAFCLNTLALVGSSIEKMATEIRNLQRTEISEVQEPFVGNQIGSSAMPHKINPIISERLCGLARILRGYAQIAMENVSLWGERDISHSSTERFILPNSTILLDYMLNKFNYIMENLIVFPENMKRNIGKSKGLIFSENVLLELIKSGLSRDKAYELVKKCSVKVFKDKISFKKALLINDEIHSILTNEQIDKCLDIKSYLKNIDFIINKLKLIKYNTY